MNSRAPGRRPVKPWLVPPTVLPLERPIGVAVDIVVFTVIDRSLRVLLTLRTEPPFEGSWSLPGGFVELDESAERAAERELETKTSVSGIFLEQLFTFTEPDRDPRARVVSIAYYALVAAERLKEHGGTRESRWFGVVLGPNGGLEIDARASGVGALPEGGPEGETASLAFDHGRILRTAVERIRGKLSYAPIGFQLLAERFTLTEIQQVYEAVLGRPIDKRNFRAKLMKSGLVREIDAYRTGAHRPARLYEFVDRTF